ncbi:MAG: glycosyltransferase [Chlorobi bacterium]|nr:MAG: glycosyltransferase [Bacteroidota bacterium]KXK35180.1 MAG: glycosyltransferase [Chlorobi bacterium OLB6]MBE2265807.1 glycosyltransferase [Flavobacteriales bacterium]MBL1160499.1 glycosyltransferase [Chlorobiota bacterium]MBW7853252.1 glycosyltransferase [Candidatus Kapabacteria bacterium]MCC6331259.1 glycosyltransferase [Ignavibacteria bacterium]
MPQTLVGVTLYVLCGLLILYPFTVYPAILWVLASMKQRKVSDAGNTANPEIDIVIAAFNEETNIAQCLQQILTMEYEPEKVRILIANDGSTDATASILNRLGAADGRITVFHLPRGGKNAALDHACRYLHAEITVFMDADVVLQPFSIGTLVQPFSDTDIGGVLSVIAPNPASDAAPSAHAGESVYRIIDRTVNQLESRVNSTVTSNGALYAIRRSLYRNIGNSRSADDLAHVLAVLHAGKRVVVNPRVRVQEQRETNEQDLNIEAARTVRTVSSGMAAIWQYRTLLQPRFGMTAFSLWSHRIVRYLSPLAYGMMIIATFLTIRNPTVFAILLYSHLVFIGLALLSKTAGRMGITIPVIWIAEYFIVMNYSLFRGLVLFLRKRSYDKWTPGAS